MPASATSGSASTVTCTACPTTSCATSSSSTPIVTWNCDRSASTTSAQRPRGQRTAVRFTCGDDAANGARSSACCSPSSACSSVAWAWATCARAASTCPARAPASSRSSCALRRVTLGLAPPRHWHPRRAGVGVRARRSSLQARLRRHQRLLGDVKVSARPLLVGPSSGHRS